MMGIVFRGAVIQGRWIVLTVMLSGNIGVNAQDSELTATPFRLNERLVAQAHRAAAAELAQPRHMKLRRPKGLDSLETPQEIASAVHAAMGRLYSDDRDERMRGYNQLRYLGDEAFAAVVQGASDENLDASKLCTELLGDHGPQAVVVLIPYLNSSFPNADVAEFSLIQLGDPASIPLLIEALTSARAREDTECQKRIGKILCSFHDEHAESALQQDGKLYLAEVRQKPWLLPCHAIKGREPEWFDQTHWPAVLLPIRRLCRDAITLKGEGFGPAELEQIKAHFAFPQSTIMTREICQAFVAYGDPAVVPEVIEACRRYNELNRSLIEKTRPKPRIGSIQVSMSIPILDHHQKRMRQEKISSSGFSRFWLYYVFSVMPTPQAVDFVVESIEAPGRDVRSVAVTTMRTRWAVPLWIGCLDDEEHLTQPYPLYRRGYREKTGVMIPQQHLIYNKLAELLGQFELPARTFVVSREASSLEFEFNIRREIERVKSWWDRHGEDFLAGESVPNPDLISIDVQ